MAIAKAQITNGGPVILVQLENEYSLGANTTGGFPDPWYMAAVKKQFLDAGIVVPLINNDAWNQGLFAPGKEFNGTEIGNFDIYGHDAYPLGFDCSTPDFWPPGKLPTYFYGSHLQQSPLTPFSLVEFQGGSLSGWGGPQAAACADLVSAAYERVAYKNNIASGVKLFNLYMIYGGTNWGNLGFPGSQTSYDYGAAIAEDRTIAREKYSELKLQAQFLKVSPAYLTMEPDLGQTGVWTDTSELFTTPLRGNGSATAFYIVRHAMYESNQTVNYHLAIPSSRGSLDIPQLGGQLTLNGRDSKWHVVDYQAGNHQLLYCTAEVFTWNVVGDKTILVVYGAVGEAHELAVVSDTPALILEGHGIITEQRHGTTILQWRTLPNRQVIQLGKLTVYAVDRFAAYKYWVTDLPRNDTWGA